MRQRRAPDTEAAVLSEAYGSARELLRQAEEDAARIRADADRYRRQREQEAELIVAKARRVLTMAEDLVAAPRPVVVDLDVPVAAGGWDVDAPLVPVDDVAVEPGSRRTRRDLDSILANAVSNAIHRALPTDR